MTGEDEEDEGCETGIEVGGILHIFLMIYILILLPISKVPSNCLVASTVSNSTKANLTRVVVLSLTILTGKKNTRMKYKKI